MINQNAQHLQLMPGRRQALGLRLQQMLQQLGNRHTGKRRTGRLRGQPRL